ncbi:Adipocyte plasma membrane-associated protein [Aphelenchoides besseyi]|nr:Adipocyte plasma membrane-associated protein [Aphelenchoides besseyi]
MKESFCCFILTPVKDFVGPLAPKKFVTNVEYVLKNKIHGPECIVLHNHAIYTGTSDGKIVKIVNDKIVKELALSKDPLCKKLRCSRPLGMRYWKDEKIVFADAQLGIFVADFATEKIRQVISSKTFVGGLANMFPDGKENQEQYLAFIDDEHIIFSDMSSKCGESNFGLCFLELAEDGRLIKLNLNTGEWEVILENINSPNGVMQHPDKDSVLVTQIVYYKGAKKGKFDVIADGLPGVVDNIRESPSGKSFWLAIPHGANKTWRPIGQMLAPYPNVRRLIAYLRQLPEALRVSMLALGSPSYNVLIEMNFDGKIINSIHDPNNLIDFCTHIEDSGTHLYFGSYVKNEIRRIKKP